MDAEIISQFLLEAGKDAPGTAVTYTSAIKLSLAQIAKPLFSITKGDVLKWLNELDATDKALGYKRTLRAAMFSLFDYVSDHHEEFKNPKVSKHAFDFTKPFGIESSQAPLLSIEQVQTILDAARNDPRDYVLFLVLAHTGMRISECLTIRIENIHIEERYLETGIEPICRKSSRLIGKALVVPLSHELAAVLEDYLSFINRKEGWLFPSPSKLDDYITKQAIDYKIGTYKEKTGIDFSAHSFRASLITNRKMAHVDGKEKIEDWESEVIMNHVPKSLENRVYLRKPAEFKVALYDRYDVMKGVI